MADILDKFIENAQMSVKEGYYDIKPMATMQKKSLQSAILSTQFGIIAEIKHASPAGEYSFDSIDVPKTARLFKDAGATAISVVVEPKIFKGNLKNANIAKQAGLPVLFKDFVFDKVQIKAAKNVGADCILLVMKVADRLGLEIQPLIDEAHANSLEVLLECYNVDEMKRALATNADVFGVNNRDLQTLKVDLNRTKEIFSMAPGDGRPLISESGIRVREDSEFVKNCGARAILVGTAIWKAEDQTAKIRELKLV